MFRVRVARASNEGAYTCNGGGAYMQGEDSVNSVEWHIHVKGVVHTSNGVAYKYNKPVLLMGRILHVL